jgi:hypothetical protein
VGLATSELRRRGVSCTGREAILFFWWCLPNPAARIEAGRKQQLLLNKQGGV